MRRWLALLVTIPIFFGVICGWLTLQWALNYRLQFPPEQTYWQLKPGQGLHHGVRFLREVEAHPWPELLLLAAKFQGEMNLKAGEYELRNEMSTSQWLSMLRKGDVITYRITFVEGTNLRDWRKILKQHSKLLPTTGNYSKQQLTEVLGHEGSLEGWLLPETYVYSAGDKDIDVLRQAYKNMQDVLNNEWQQRSTGLPFDHPYQALIMASIVEKETGLAEERNQIAGVFVRRLQQGMRLQSDPTTIYGLGERYTGNLTRVNLRENTPYNTYRINGLPPTPIAMPGKHAIQAALNPTPGSALYFVAKGDGSHVFSDSLEEHNKAVQYYQVTNRRRNYKSSPIKNSEITMTGLFITVEGTEGGGKSTNIAFIQDYLESCGITVVKTREPGGTPLAEEIRQLLLNSRKEHVHSMTELLLIFAARAQHLRTFIEPQLQQGHWILCDRFTDATYAYQGGGRQMDEELIAQLETMVQGQLRPNVTFLLDLPVEVGLQRARERGEPDRFEKEKLEFFESVRLAYLHRASIEPNRYMVVDASQSIQQVQQQIQHGLENLVTDWKLNN